MSLACLLLELVKDRNFLWKCFFFLKSAELGRLLPMSVMLRIICAGHSSWTQGKRWGTVGSCFLWLP